MDVFHTNRSGNIYYQGNTYCTDCVSDFCNRGGYADDFDGPYGDGGGEADLIRHCDYDDKCVRAMVTQYGLVGVCFRNDLTPEGVAYTLDTLQEYIDVESGIPEVLDVWAEELRNYPLYKAGDNILDMYNDKRAKKRSLDAVVDRVYGYRKKQDTKVDSMMAFFDDRPVVSEAIHCGSCKDTGIIMLFNSSVECTDCTQSSKNVAEQDKDIVF